MTCSRTLLVWTALVCGLGTVSSSLAQGPVPPTPAPPFCGECHGAKNFAEIDAVKEGTAANHETVNGQEHKDKSSVTTEVENPYPHPEVTSQ